MVTVPLGTNAYKRTYSGSPEIKLVNRYMEKQPQNLREHIALISRPGTMSVAQFAGGVVRGLYSVIGFMDSDLFVVSGPNFYRYTVSGVKTQITGVIYEGQTPPGGFPYVTWMKGIGYEYLFISDGLQLQYYDGGTHATGTLTSSGAITNQVIQIGGAYYSWSLTPAAGLQDGTSANPWLALRGGTVAASLLNMANLIVFFGVPGVDFSTSLPGPNLDYTATSDATHLFIRSTGVTSASNTIATTVFSGAGLAWGAATLTGATVGALRPVQVPNGEEAKALTTLSGYVLVSIGKSQKFYWINPGEVVIDPLNFASKESNPDAIVDMLTVGDQAMISGGQSTENWYATGNFAAPFAPVEGRVYQRGTIDGTMVVVKDAVILVGNDGIVYEVGYSVGTTAEWGVHRISDNGIEERVRTQLRREAGLT
jgi:hypothetical protein